MRAIDWPHDPKSTAASQHPTPPRGVQKDLWENLQSLGNDRPKVC